MAALGRVGAEIWKQDAVVRTFLESVRGGIPLAAEQIGTMLRVVSAACPDVRRFADLGCGAGALAAAMRSRFPQAAGVLIDSSEPMLSAARQQLTSAGAFEFVAADLAAPAWAQPYASRPFDAIVSGYAIHHLPDARKQALYAEIFRLLRPGGVFVNIEHVASASAWVEGLSDEEFIDALYAFQHARDGARTRERVAQEFHGRPDKAFNILAPVEVQCAWLRACGFADVDCYFKVFELAVFGGRRLQ